MHPDRTRRLVTLGIGISLVGCGGGSSSGNSSGGGSGSGSGSGSGGGNSGGPGTGTDSGPVGRWGSPLPQLPEGLRAVYSDRQSYLPGDRGLLFVDSSTESQAVIRLLDVSGREVFRVVGGVRPQTPGSVRPWEDGFGYVDPLPFVLPDLPSGIYLWEGVVTCVVRAPKGTPLDVMVLYPSNTECAYNLAGGQNFYDPDLPNQAKVLSFARPGNGDGYSNCRFFYEWLQRQAGWVAGHLCDLDMEDPQALASARLLVVAGHSEYWTRLAREHFDAFVDRGGHVLVLSGNTMWWQVRYANEGRQLVCYKSQEDPVVDPLAKTICWTDRRLAYPPIRSIGADFSHGGYGRKPDQGWDGLKIVAAASPIFKGTGLQAGDVLSLSTIEWDGAPISGFATDGTPQLDLAALGFHRADLLGYDIGFRGRETIGTWMAFQKTPESGIVIHGGSTDWCAARGMGGPSGEFLRLITGNMIRLLLAGTYPV